MQSSFGLAILLEGTLLALFVFLARQTPFTSHRPQAQVTWLVTLEKAKAERHAKPSKGAKSVNGHVTGSAAASAARTAAAASAQTAAAASARSNTLANTLGTKSPTAGPRLASLKIVSGTQNYGASTPRALLPPLADQGADHGPIPYYNPVPQIPERLRHERQHRSVQIEFFVSAQAMVTPRVTDTSGNSELDQLAIDSTRQWKFHPAEARGRAVDSQVRVRIYFQII